MRVLFALAAALVALCLSSPGWAADEPKLTPAEQAEADRLSGILKSLKPRHGDVALPGVGAHLKLGEAYYFLDKADARKVIVDAWGNPPANADGVLGMVLPEGKTPYDSWGAIVTYDATGFVDDKDAQSTNYDEMLKQVHDGEDSINAERKKAGFQTIHVVGWAQPPSYDGVRHSMVWARDIQFGGDEVDTLNYDVRLLGRRGVLSLNMVSTMPELTAVRDDARRLAQTANFDAGAGYGDFNPASDDKAAYGVAGLVAAGLGVAVAKKVGLIGVILLFAKKGIVLIVAAFGVIANWFRGLLGGKRKTKAGPVNLDAVDDPPAEREAPAEVEEKEPAP